VRGGLDERVAGKSSGGSREEDSGVGWGNKARDPRSTRSQSERDETFNSHKCSDTVTGGLGGWGGGRGC